MRTCDALHAPCHAWGVFDVCACVCGWAHAGPEDPEGKGFRMKVTDPPFKMTPYATESIPASELAKAARENGSGLWWVSNLN